MELGEDQIAYVKIINTEKKVCAVTINKNTKINSSGITSFLNETGWMMGNTAKTLLKYGEVIDEDGKTYKIIDKDEYLEMTNWNEIK